MQIRVFRPHWYELYIGKVDFHLPDHHLDPGYFDSFDPCIEGSTIDWTVSRFYRLCVVNTCALWVLIVLDVLYHVYIFYVPGFPTAYLCCNLRKRPPPPPPPPPTHTHTHSCTWWIAKSCIIMFQWASPARKCMVWIFTFYCHKTTIPNLPPKESHIHS